MRFPLYLFCARSPPTMTKIYTNVVYGVLRNRPERATHTTTRPKRRLNESTRVFSLFRYRLPPRLATHSLQGLVRDNYKLSQLSYSRLVRDNYKLFYLGRKTATLANWKISVRKDRKLFNSTLHYSALSLTLSPHEVRRATLLRCNASSSTSISVRSAPTRNTPL